MLEQVFKELGLSDIGHRIYIELLENGAASARMIANNLGIPRPSVYGHLNALVESGLVAENDKENIKIFEIEDIKKLPEIINDKMNVLKEEKNKVEQLIPSLSINNLSIEPRMKLYNGTSGVKEILKDLLRHKNIKTITMWPISEMVSVLGKDYLEDLNRKRIRQDISIRGIWPYNKKVDLKSYPFLGVGRGHLRDLRIAPKNMDWNMSYWLYENKVAFISSHKETFGFVINSRDFASLIRSQFEVIWNISKKVKPQEKYTDAFLKTI